MKAFHKSLLAMVVPTVMILILYYNVSRRAYSFNIQALTNMWQISKNSSLVMQIEGNFTSKPNKSTNSSSQVDAENDDSEQHIINEILALKTKKFTDMTCRRLFSTGLLDKRLGDLRRAGRGGGDGGSEDSALHMVMRRLKRFVRGTKGHKKKKEDHSKKGNTNKQLKQFKYNNKRGKSEKYFQSTVGYLKKLSAENRNGLEEERLFQEPSHQLKPVNHSSARRFRRKVNMEIDKRSPEDTLLHGQDTRDKYFGRGMLFMEPYYEMAKDVPSALYRNLTTVAQTRLEQVRGHYPWLPCRLFQYSFREARLCAARLELQSKMPLGMTFFGDSRARKLMGDTFEALEDEAWRLYFTPRHDTQPVAVVDVKLIRDVVDHMNLDRNITWVDRLMRAEFDVTHADMNTPSWAENPAEEDQNTPQSLDVEVNIDDGSPRVIEESSNKQSAIKKSSSEFNKSRNGSSEYFPANYDRKINSSEHEWRESGEIQTSEDPAVVNSSVLDSHHPSNKTGDLTGNKNLPEEKLTEEERQQPARMTTGLIRLQYRLGIYPYWKEMEGSIPTLLDILRPYEQKPVLEVPSIVVISCILWEVQSSKKEMLQGLDHSAEQLRLARPELFIILRSLAAKGATIVWMLLDPVRDTLVKSDGSALLEKPHPFSDQVAEWFNTVLAVMLLPLVEEGTVMLWDTVFPVSVRVNKDCAALMKASNKTQQLSEGVPWKCYDFVHPGPQADQVNAQILLNYACNDQIQDVLQTHGQDYCCAGL